MQISGVPLNLSKKQLLLLILVVLLLLAIPVGVYLTQNTQIFKPRATGNSNWVNAFEIKDENNNTITCVTTGDVPECTTDSPNIKVRVKPESLNLLQ